MMKTKLTITWALAVAITLMQTQYASSQLSLMRGDKPVAVRPVLIPEVAEAIADIEAQTAGSTLLVECNGVFGYGTIQGAIDAAEDGDVVVILPRNAFGFECDGDAYVENINFLGKSITVQSLIPTNTDYIEHTIIDGSQSSSVVIFENGEDFGTLLDGLTVTNGAASGGGGIYCSGSSPTISNCIIADNNAHRGAGIYCENDSKIIIRGCTITANIASLYGGGYNSPDSSPQVINCAFIGNSALRGGAMFGGGNPEVFNCRFDSNSAVHYGGAAHLTDFTFRNCVFSNNSAGIFGGGIRIICRSPTLSNCTLTGNSAGGSGGGIHNFEGCGPCSPILANCILWGNSDSGGVDESAQIAGGTPVFDYSCVQGWTGQLGGCGNIDLDPKFVDEDYHIGRDSLVRNAGDPDFVPEEDETDMDGDPRVQEGRVDMGADEFVLEQDTAFEVSPVEPPLKR